MAKRFTVETVFKAIDKITAPVTRMQNRVGKFTRAAGRGIRALNKSVKALTKGLARAGKVASVTLVAGLVAVGTATLGVIKQFSKVENAEAAFTPLLGGVEKAKRLVEELNTTAATTPFQFEALADKAGTLLPVMNGNIKETIKTLRMLGDTAGGNADKLDSITRGFTKAMLKGKVDLESLNMIAEAGVPIFTELAKTMDVKMGAAFFKLISAGKVSTKLLTKTFRKMTSEGGLFFRGMEIASATTTGLWSTLMDNIALTAAEVGSVLAPTVKGLIKQATTVAKKMREWVKANKGLIESKFLKFVAGAKKAVVGIIAVFRELNAEHNLLERLVGAVRTMADAVAWLATHGKFVIKLTATIVALSTALSILTGVMTLVNIVMTANPIGLVVVGIAALVAAVAGLIFWWDELSAAGTSLFNKMPIWAQALVTVVGGILGAFVKILQGAFDLVAGIGSAILLDFQPLETFFSNLADSVTGFFSALASGAADAAQAVAEFAGFGGDKDVTVTRVVKPAAPTAAAAPVPQLVKTAVATATSPAAPTAAAAPVLQLVKTAVTEAVKPVAAAVETAAPAVVKPVLRIVEAEAETARAEAETAQVVTPQERVARTVEESRTTSTAEITIRDETGRAEVTRGELGNGVRLLQSGEF